ncbi:unnamed protein product, partial [Didymodactylos carnosus]
MLIAYMPCTGFITMSLAATFMFSGHQRFLYDSRLLVDKDVPR